APGARRFESYEINFAGRIGLTVAASYALELGMDRIEARIAHLSGYLRAALQEIPGVSLHDLGKQLNGIVSFTKSGTTPEALVAHLADHRVNISAVPAHMARLDLGARGVDGVARASVHYFNTEAEIDRLCTAVRSG
ncbi:MAG: aminotransferase class V-fold PLP-dependent enzyme, partial [Pseudomonadota bacterium]